MRYYYKDENGNYYNLKTPHFMVNKEVEEEQTFLDENGEEKTEMVTVVRYMLEDGYTQITEEEFNEHIKPAELSEETKAIIEKQNRIAVLKSLLSGTDYKAIKYAEGLFTEEEYAPIKAQRQEWRAEINQLEETL